MIFPVVVSLAIQRQPSLNSSLSEETQGPLLYFQRSYFLSPRNGGLYKLFPLKQELCVGHGEHFLDEAWRVSWQFKHSIQRAWKGIWNWAFCGSACPTLCETTPLSCPPILFTATIKSGDLASFLPGRGCGLAGAVAAKYDFQTGSFVVLLWFCTSRLT